MKQPTFTPSKMFLGEYELPCLVAELKNSEVTGLATQYTAEFGEDPTFAIYLRVKNPDGLSAWMQKRVEQLFGQEELATAIAEGIKDLPDDSFDHLTANEQHFIKTHGYHPFVFIREMVIDEVKKTVLILIDDGLDIIHEHLATIRRRRNRWRLGDYDEWLRYTGAFEKYLPKPDVRKWEEKFPQLSGGWIDADVSIIRGRWVCDRNESERLCRELGWNYTQDATPNYYTITESHIEEHPSIVGHDQIEGIKRRGNWIRIKGARLNMLIWCDGQKMIRGWDKYVPPDGRVFLRVADDYDPRWEIGEKWSALLPAPDMAMPIELDAPAMFGVWDFDKGATMELLKKLGEDQSLIHVLSSSPSIWFSLETMEALTQGYTISATKIRTCERRGDWVLMLFGGQSIGSHSMFWCDGTRLIDLEVKRVYRRVADASRKGITVAELIRNKK